MLKQKIQFKSREKTIRMIFALDRWADEYKRTYSKAFCIVQIKLQEFLLRKIWIFNFSLKMSDGHVNYNLMYNLLYKFHDFETILKMQLNSKHPSFSHRFPIDKIFRFLSLFR